MAGGTQGEETSLIARAYRVLASFDDDAPELGTGQLAERARLPRATAHRVATELARFGLLERTGPGLFTIGTRLWELGELAPVAARLRESAFPVLERLYEASGENVHLAVLAGSDPETAEALYVARVSGETSIPTLSRAGGRLPLHTTGVGKALLMTRDDEWLARFFRRRLERETTFSITDERRLRAELATARERGYATTRQEMTLGNFSVAAPLPELAGFAPAAVGIVSHIGRANESALAPVVRRAAQDIAAATAAATARAAPIPLSGTRRFGHATRNESLDRRRRRPR